MERAFNVIYRSSDISRAFPYGHFFRSRQTDTFHETTQHPGLDQIPGVG